MSLELAGVTFAYSSRGLNVLENFSLVVDVGESVALMAPSGRGKSTIMSLAGLLLRPDAGEVRIAGEVAGPQDMDRYLGGTITWVLQSTNLIARRSIIDNVLLPALIQGSSRAEALPGALAALRRVGLNLDESRQARTLSGGEAQRVGVARALVTSPVLILADEPTANLDAHNSRLVCDALFEKSGSAILVATHDAAVAERADRTVRL